MCKYIVLVYRKYAFPPAFDVTIQKQGVCDTIMASMRAIVDVIGVTDQTLDIPIPPKLPIVNLAGVNQG